MIENVFMDLGDTLVDAHGFFDGYWTRRTAEFLKEEGHGMPEEKVRQAIWKAMLMLEEEYGGDPKKHDKDVFVMKLFEVVGIKMPKGVMIEFADEFFESLVTEIKLKPGVKDALDWLKSEGYPITIISNGTDYAIRNLIRNLGLGKYFTAVITSEGCGGEKSTLKPFRKAFEMTGADPKKSVMVGDRLDEDIFGANKMRMKSVLISSAWGEMNPPSEKVKPDYVIKRLIELKGVLGEMNADN
jgi:HAD superfamily hydrolase (TIGR01662 family)